eukprot:TRINITY_DN3971_c0_g1_i1.p1 TRINITY_DN3971_c0_g1~~TRINITY_DN3971_c0_g1_i1.p1  ORF type:complete len:499 (+),score=89.37 TRINITY_DN3971_c0_g1_i1:49-1545(+)
MAFGKGEFCIFAVILFVLSGATFASTNDQNESVCLTENFNNLSPLESTFELTLSESDSDAHRSINQIAQILLQEIGKVKVRTESHDNVDWDGIKDGSQLHGHLFVRPYDITEKSDYIYENYWVEDVGPLGVHGYSGLFMPTYVFDMLNELSVSQQIGRLDHTFLLLPEVISLFRGRIQNLPMNQKSSKWYAQFVHNVLGNGYVIDAVDNLPEALTRIQIALDNKRPLLFFLEYPDPVFLQYNLTRVLLPGFTDECYEKSRSGGTDCDFPQTHIHKLIWPGIEDTAPGVHQFLEEFALTDMDMEKLMSDFLVSRSHRVSACNWIKANTKRWKLFFVDTPAPVSVQGSIFSFRNFFRLFLLLGTSFVLFRYHAGILQTLGIGTQTWALTFWYFFNRIVPPKSSLNVTIQVWFLSAWYWWRRITGQSRDAPIDETAFRSPTSSRVMSRKSSTTSISSTSLRGSGSFTPEIDAKPVNTAPTPRNSYSPVVATGDLRKRLLSG